MLTIGRFNSPISGKSTFIAREFLAFKRSLSSSAGSQTLRNHIPIVAARVDRGSVSFESAPFYISLLGMAPFFLFQFAMLLSYFQFTDFELTDVKNSSMIIWFSSRPWETFNFVLPCPGTSYFMFSIDCSNSKMTESQTLHSHLRSKNGRWKKRSWSHAREFKDENLWYNGNSVLFYAMVES